MVLLVFDVAGLVVFSSRVVSTVKGRLLNNISTLISSSSSCSRSALVKSRFWKGCCFDGGRNRSPDAAGTRKDHQIQLGRVEAMVVGIDRQIQLGLAYLQAHQSIERGQL